MKLRRSCSSAGKAEGLGRIEGFSADGKGEVNFTDSVIGGGWREIDCLAITGASVFFSGSIFFSGSTFAVAGSGVVVVDVLELPFHHFPMASSSEAALFDF